MKFTSRALPRTKIAIIVLIHPIRNKMQIVLFRQRLKLRKQFGFAEVAAIKVVGNVPFVLQLVRFQRYQGNTHLTGDGYRFLRLLRCIGR